MTVPYFRWKVIKLGKTKYHAAGDPNRLRARASAITISYMRTSRGSQSGSNFQVQGRPFASTLSVSVSKAGRGQKTQSIFRSESNALKYTVV